MQSKKQWREKQDPCGYIKAILNAWKTKGITTLKEAQEENKKTNEAESMQDVWSRFLLNHKEEATADGT